MRRWVSIGCWWAAVSAWSAAIFGVVGTVGPFTAMAVALTPVVTLVVTVSGFTAALFRQWWPAVASAGVLIWVVGPGLAESEREVSTVSVDAVVIVSSNVRAGNEHIGELVERLVAQGPDVIVLQEIEGSGLEAIRNTGISREYPFALFDPLDGYFGGAILSRWPLVGTVERVGGYPMTMATIETPTGPLDVLNVHVAPPISSRSYDLWMQQLDELHDRLRSADRPLVMLGDFNATGHHAELRALADVGSDRGMAAFRSFPAAGWMPPVLSLDHAFASGGACLLEVLGVAENPGSDHRALMATLASPYTLDAACR